jgi:hypothetical protein
LFFIFELKGIFMGIKFDGKNCTPKEFAKFWTFNNLCLLKDNADAIFNKYPEKYAMMTERERGYVKEGIENVVNTIERCLGLEKVRAKKGKLK